MFGSQRQQNVKGFIWTEVGWFNHDSADEEISRSRSLETPRLSRFIWRSHGVSVNWRPVFTMWHSVSQCVLILHDMELSAPSWGWEFKSPGSSPRSHHPVRWFILQLHFRLWAASPLGLPESVPLFVMELVLILASNEKGHFSPLT